MAVINDPNTAANIAAVGEKATGATGALHVTLKPIPMDAAVGGHYRITHRGVTANTQAANSRLFEIRNPSATKLLIPTRMVVKIQSLSAHTAILEDSIDLFKLTSFSAVDTVNTVTLTASKKRTSMQAQSAVIRGNTVAGAAAGMTGGTLTKDAAAFCQVPIIQAQAAMAAGDTISRDFFRHEIFDDNYASHPFVFAQDEGFECEWRVVDGAAGGLSYYIDLAFAEVAAY